MKNKLFIVITFIISSSIIHADGFFHSVGNVATLGELDRSEKRQDDKKYKSKNKKQQNKSAYKKSNKNRRTEDEQ